MQLPVTLRLKPSPTLAIALVLAHGAVAVGLTLAGLPLAAVIPCGLLLACSLALALRRRVLRPAVRALTLKGDGRVEIEAADGNRAEASVLPHTTVFPWLAVLLLRTAAGRVALTLPPDALDAGAHRLLRLWLRWRVD